jgi:hypothetical protein
MTRRAVDLIRVHSQGTNVSFLAYKVAQAIFVLTMTQCDVWRVVPTQVLIAVPVAFHLVRIALGYSMADAIHSGWLLSSEVRFRATISIPHFQTVSQ